MRMREFGTGFGGAGSYGCGGQGGALCGRVVVELGRGPYGCSAGF